MFNFIKSFWSSSVFTWVGLMLGAVSTLKLIQFGFDHQFGVTLTSFLAAYEQLVTAIVEVELPWWSEPLIQLLVRALNSIFGEFALHPHWKHVFVLLSLYFSRAASADFKAGLFGSGVFRTVWGVLIGLACGIACGAISLADRFDSMTNFFFASIPVLGLLIFNIGDVAWSALNFRAMRDRVLARTPPRDRTWHDWAKRMTPWEYFITPIPMYMLHATVGLALITVGLQVPAIQQLTSPALGLLGVLTFIFAVFRLWTGVNTVPATRTPSETWLTAFWRTQGARTGAAMLGVFFWAAVGLLVDVALVPYGL